jgi:hypothetical protein
LSVISDFPADAGYFCSNSMVRYFILLIIVLAGEKLAAQDTIIRSPLDSGPHVLAPNTNAPQNNGRAGDARIGQDTAMKTDSLLPPFRDSIFHIVSTNWSSDSFHYLGHPYFRFTNPVRYAITIKKWQGKEAIFYTLIALLLFFALIKNGFYRYLQDLFKTFFRTSIKQRQIKDQLLQSPLPSLLLNVFFLLSIGMFLALLLQYFRLGQQFNFWLLFLYCTLALIAIYGVKFITLKLFGWIFQLSEAIDTYIFIIFSTNKIIGISLLPFLIVLSFSNGPVNQAAIPLSLFMVGGLLVYRFFLTYVSVHRQVQISFLHFILYLAAFEIAPLLLINKLLFTFLT